MHENFQFAATLIAIHAGILFARDDQREVRADFRRMEDRLDGRIDKVEGRVERLSVELRDLQTHVDGEFKALRKDYSEFYAEQRRHDGAIETLKKK